MTWMVYVLVSGSSSSTYVGISTDPGRRLEQHNGTARGGAKSTRAGRPWSLGTVYGPYETRSEASRAEYRVKKLKGTHRLAWDDSSL